MALRTFLIFVPLAIAAQLAGLGFSVVFIFSFLAIIPLASISGEATEVLARFSGPKIGGLLNATFGTLPEIIISFALLRSGQIEILKASIIGGILMSLLVTVGLSLLVGGLKNGLQKFDQSSVGMATTTMLLAVVGLLIPTLFGVSKQIETHSKITSRFQDAQTDELSVLVALILFGLYLSTVAYQLRAPEGEELSEAGTNTAKTPAWSLKAAIGILVGATAATAVMGEFLSGAIAPFGQSLGLSPLFIGIVLLPIAGGVSEMIVSVRMALRKKINLSISIPMNGAMQGALFVAPLLVFLSLFLGTPLTLYFSTSQIISSGLAVSIAAYIAIDGVTSWLEGGQLLALWGILAVWFYFLTPIY